MKRFLLICTSLLITTLTMSQDITGKWQGLIKVGSQQLRFVMNISKTTAGYKSSFDSPDQNVFNLDGSKTSFINDSIIVEIAVMHGGYSGKWDGKDSIIGLFSQSSVTLNLNMHRLLKENVISSSNDQIINNKPQTPKPPFLYNVQEVEYNNSDKSLHYGATLTTPKGVKNFPTVIIISGSGSQDRDGTILGHKYYAVLADYLTKNGIGVLRVDDRGTGKSSTGNNIDTITSESFAKDVEASLDYLLARNDIDKKKLGLIGHSEGGIIAPMVAARRKEIAFIILWGAPAVNGGQILAEQTAHKLKLDGVEEQHISAFSSFNKSVLSRFSIIKKEELSSMIDSLYISWKTKQSKETLSALQATDNSILGRDNTKFYHSLYDVAWWRFFISYEPATNLSKVKCPVLAVTGAKDTQVDAKENLPLIKAILNKSGNQNVQVTTLASLNHFLQSANTGDISENESIEETMSPTALSLMAGWIKDQMGNGK